LSIVLSKIFEKVREAGSVGLFTPQCAIFTTVAGVIFGFCFFAPYRSEVIAVLHWVGDCANTIVEVWTIIAIYRAMNVVTSRGRDYLNLSDNATEFLRREVFRLVIGSAGDTCVSAIGVNYYILNHF
jgi:hypothetical protein